MAKHSRVRKITLDWLLETEERSSQREKLVIRIGAGLYKCHYSSLGRVEGYLEGDRLVRYGERDEDLYAIKRPEKGRAEMVLFNLDQYRTGREEITQRHSVIEETIEKSGVERYGVPFGLVSRAGLDLRALKIVDKERDLTFVQPSSLLLAQGGRRVLVEIDSSSNCCWYAADVGRSDTVEEARSRLVPPIVRSAESYERQGRWFFTPAPEIEGRLEGRWEKNGGEGFPGFLLEDGASSSCSHIATWGAVYRRSIYVKGTVRHWHIDGHRPGATDRHRLLKLDGVHRAVPSQVEWLW